MLGRSELRVVALEVSSHKDGRAFTRLASPTTSRKARAHAAVVFKARSAWPPVALCGSVGLFAHGARLRR